MGMSYADVDVVAKAIPHELGMTLKNALRFPELKSLYESSDQIRKLVDTAMSPLAMGTSHAPTESMVATLQGTPYDTGLELAALDVVAKHFNKIRTLD